jgi:hypothetical protein
MAARKFLRGVEVGEIILPPERPKWRRRRVNTFVQVPLSLAAKLMKTTRSPGGMVALIIYYEVWANKGRPFPLSNIKLAGYRIGARAKRSALKKMQADGFITVDYRPGRAPLVTWVGPDPVRCA